MEKLQIMSVELLNLLKLNLPENIGEANEQKFEGSQNRCFRVVRQVKHHESIYFTFLSVDLFIEHFQVQKRFCYVSAASAASPNSETT